ncbi:MAG: hypothetical protein A2X94_07805 [Bdellovibrionales bacterium GWB1_55_8]|nr:MAG: hypothetical protein A2X94_07805 [Bdellovibrionales bacterium GWB1_55_8]
MGIGIATLGIGSAIATMLVKRRRIPALSRSAALNVLVVRPDRLGDVVLSTPVFEAIKREFPKSHVTAWVKPFVKTLIENTPFVDEVVTWETNGDKSGMGLGVLLAEIRKRRFDVAIVLQTERKLARIVYKSGIPIRVGPWSKPHSFFFYNLGMRQHRSEVKMHEADYNLQLLETLGIVRPEQRLPTRVHLEYSVRGEAREWLIGKGWSEDRPLVAVHPGMGGSALNWPLKHYAELIRELAYEGRAVLVTGGITEANLLKEIQGWLGESSRQVIWYVAGPDKGLDFLAGLFSWSSVVVAPSTGPLHLAVALGRPVVSFYPPIRVQSAKRWGPYVEDSSRAAVLSPEGICKETFRCRKHRCEVNDDSCMRSLPVEDALKYTRRYLGEIK